MRNLSASLRVLVRLYAHLSPRRRWQLLLTSGLTLVGATAELATIGAVIPFVGVLLNVNSRSTSFLPQHLPVMSSGALTIAITVSFAALALSTACIRVAVLWITTRFVYALGEDISVKVFSDVLNKPLKYHLKHNSSEAVALINKSKQLTSNLVLPLMIASSNALIAFAISAGLLIVSPTISICAFLCFAAIYALVALFSKKRLIRNSVTASVSYSEQTKVLQEGLGAIRDILLDRSQSYFLARFQESERSIARAQAANAVIGLSPRYIVESLGMIVIAALVCTLVVSGHEITSLLPSLGALVLGAQRLLPSMQSIYYGYSQVSANWGSLTEVIDFLEEPSRDVDQISTSRLPFVHKIEVKGLSFRHEGSSSNILDQINLCIEKGSKVGFIGRTGCGKSTFMDLVMGLSEPTAGRIIIDDAILTPSNLANWRCQVSHVPQNIYLADVSVKENIALGIDRRLIDNRRIADVSRMAAIEEFSAKLPRGLDTLVGERGARLSGGQKQRIGIARALYKRPELLILDESTSALDEETERQIMQTIFELGRSQTVFIIAHRLKTILKCDVVYELSTGGISRVDKIRALNADVGS